MCLDAVNAGQGAFGDVTPEPKSRLASHACLERSHNFIELIGDIIHVVNHAVVLLGVVVTFQKGFGRRHVILDIIFGLDHLRRDRCGWIRQFWLGWLVTGHGRKTEKSTGEGGY